MSKKWFTCQHQERQPKPCEECGKPDKYAENYSKYNEECFRCRKIIKKAADEKVLIEEKHDCQPINEIKQEQNQNQKLVWVLGTATLILIIPISYLVYKLLKNKRNE